MRNHRHLTHLSLLVGFLMTAASARALQNPTARPGEQAERHLSGDQTFREWAHKADPS